MCVNPFHKRRKHPKQASGSKIEPLQHRSKDKKSAWSLPLDRTKHLTNISWAPTLHQAINQTQGPTRWHRPGLSLPRASFTVCTWAESKARVIPSITLTGPVDPVFILKILFCSSWISPSPPIILSSKSIELFRKRCTAFIAARGNLDSLPSFKRTQGPLVWHYRTQLWSMSAGISFAVIPLEMLSIV